MSEADDRARKVKTRRTKRKLKAAASVALAITAGVFLACQRGASEVSRIVDAARGEEPDAQGDTGTPMADGAITVRDASGAVQPDAGLAVDAGGALGKRAKGSAKDASVDVNEHRKGMPVRDNLLE